MTIYDLINTLEPDTRLTIHDGSIPIADHIEAEYIPPFMCDYEVESIVPRDDDLSVCIKGESILQPIIYLQQLAGDLSDLEDCQSAEAAHDEVIDRMRTLAHVAKRLAYNLETGKPWRANWNK